MIQWLRDHRKAAYVLASLILLLPVYWQPRVHAGDLTSHFDNAWLAQMLEGRTTNVLFDVILGALYTVAGAELGPRLAVSLAVLTFLWGAFAFVTAAGGRRPWYLMPCIAMLAYGWVFHMGFFNFYLSLGLCFWTLALAWNFERRRIPVAAGLLFLSYSAHAIPTIWTLGLLLYLWIARRVSERRRVLIAGAWLAIMILVHIAADRTPWSLQQIALTTGADQVWVFDSKYYIVLIGLLAVWGLLFIALLRNLGASGVVSGLPFQLCLISAAAVFILPTTILIPGFQHALVYNAERMSLGVGICVCALLGAVKPRGFERHALLIISLVFFGFLYNDEKALNSFQDRMQDTVAAAWRTHPCVPHRDSSGCLAVTAKFR